MDAQTKTLYIAVLLTSLILGIIIIFFVISIVRQQRRNLELTRLNMLAEINTLERERARIAADLHDDLGPVLATIKFKVDSVDASNEEDNVLLQKASHQIDELASRLRSIAAGLMPAVLVRKGLLPALQEFIAHVEESTSLRIHFQPDFACRLSPTQSTHIYRLIQEVVHNTVKHAGAAELFIRLWNKEGQMLHILCQDNGKGFDYEKTI